jgi:hypothetical protein
MQESENAKYETSLTLLFYQHPTVRIFLNDDTMSFIRKTRSVYRESKVGRKHCLVSLLATLQHGEFQAVTDGHTISRKPYQ